MRLFLARISNKTKSNNEKKSWGSRSLRCELGEHRTVIGVPLVDSLSLSLSLSVSLVIDVTPTLGDRRRTKERRSSFVLFPCWGRRRRRRPRHVLGRGWSQKRNKKTRKRKRNETETNRWPRARKKKQDNCNNKVSGGFLGNQVPSAAHVIATPFRFLWKVWAGM